MKTGLRTRLRPSACFAGRWVLGAALVLTATAAAQPVKDDLAQARSLASTGKLDEASRMAHRMIERDPQSADAHFLLGYILFKREQPRESLAEFTSGAALRRPGAWELKIVASDYVLLKDMSDADRWFTEVVALTPNDADTWYLLGRTKFNENDFQAAQKAFEQVLKLHPEHVEAENNLGLCWNELGDAAQAEAAFRQAIAWQGAQPGDAQPFLNLGKLLAGKNNDQALQMLTRAATLAPSNPAIFEQLGEIYLAEQKLDEAQKQYERAIALAPEISALHFKLGQIFRKQSQLERAQQEFAICARLNSTHSSATTPNQLGKPASSQPQ